ncbi:MAG TPA: hypothetical protein VFE24_07780 [Pirellulales bacterium]|jgi:hypothetical protein|nr:hypothetical protein [Pirellulales bacterium]
MSDIEIQGHQYVYQKIVAEYRVSAPAYLPFGFFTVRVVEQGSSFKATPDIAVRDLRCGGHLAVHATAATVEEAAIEAIRQLYLEIAKQDRGRELEVSDFVWIANPVEH